MNNILFILLCVLVSFLVWLIVTERVKLPIVLDIGLTFIVLGLMVCADAVAMHEAYNVRGGSLISAGLLISLYSMRRQYRKRQREMRYGEPQVIDGSHLRG